MESNEIQMPDNHQEVLDRFVVACQEEDRIIAAFLGGSYVSGVVDKFSDLDLFFITTDEDYEAFREEREGFVHLLGVPLFLEGFGQTHGYCVIFSNGTECDIWFGRENKFKDIYNGPYRVLLDKKNILTGESIPKNLTDQAVQTEKLCQQIDWFWHELSHFIKAMGRRQLWFAYGQIEAMRQICVNLARLRHDFSDPYLGDEPYFKIEHALPIDQLNPLRTTFCPMEYEAMRQSVFGICRFYQDLAPNLAKVHGITYQVELEQMMLSQLEELGNDSLI